MIARITPPQPPNMIHVSPAQLEAAIQEAEAKGDTTFWIDGSEILVDYAKYLLLFLQ